MRLTHKLNLEKKKSILCPYNPKDGQLNKANESSPGEMISMALCKTAVTPLLTHWSYCSLALSQRYVEGPGSGQANHWSWSPSWVPKTDGLRTEDCLVVTALLSPFLAVYPPPGISLVVDSERTLVCVCVWKDLFGFVTQSILSAFATSRICWSDVSSSQFDK